MNLVIDIGNTSVKVYLFEKDQIVSKNHYQLILIFQKLTITLGIFTKKLVKIVKQ